jgi:hypothetical protein
MGFSNLTRGGLTPAKMINLKTNTEVDFMFNPYEFQISKDITWEDGEEKGVDAPQSIFKVGGVRTITLALWFDTQDSGGDVTYYTSKLWEMAMIDQASIDSTTGKGLPPPVAFKWGKLYFKSIITSISETFKLFDPEGVPLRSEMSITLREYVEVGDTIDASISSGSSTAPPQVATLTGSDRLDTMALGAIAAGIVAASMATRTLMEENNIDNPLNVPPGTVLKV